VIGASGVLVLLDTFGMRATLFVPGHTAGRYPSAVEDIIKRGHEVGH